MDSQKTCVKCLEVKPLEMFPKAYSPYSDFRKECKECVVARRKKLVVNRLPDGSKKICTSCECEKLVSEFQKTETNSSGYRATCAECKRKEGREYASSHKKKNHRQYRKLHSGFKEGCARAAKAKTARVKAMTQQMKESNPCSDCGEKFPYYCMDFDHRDPSQKSDGVRDLMRAISKGKVLKEISKCDLVCVNCHKERELKRRSDMYTSKVPQRVRNRGLILNLKDNPCIDCGLKYSPSVMDFDHVRGEKLYGISVCASRFGKVKLLEEISKCDLVCARCHRIRTQSRIG